MSNPPPPSSTDSPLFDSDYETTTEEPGRSTSEGEARVFPCEQCGADLKFNIGEGAMKCPYCGHVKLVEIEEEKEIQEQDYESMLIKLQEDKEKGEHQEEGQKEIRCDACGGTVVFVGTLTSSECPYCATPVQLDDVHDAEHRIPVDAVLPFLLDHKKAQTNLVDWVKSRWFAPNDFLKKGVDGKFNGVYLPYWTFDSLTFTAYSGQRGEHYTVTVGTGKDQRTETRTRWFPASGKFQRFFDDVLVIASEGFPPGLIQELEPWPLGKCIPFSQEVLAGFLARTYDTELPAGYKEARVRMEHALTQEVRKRIGGDTPAD